MKRAVIGYLVACLVVNGTGSAVHAATQQPQRSRAPSLSRR